MSEFDRKKYMYLHRVVNRHGTVVWYFWKRPGRKIRIRGEYGSDEFIENYWCAATGETPPHPDPDKGRRKRPPTLTPSLLFAVKRSLIKSKRRAREMARDFDLDLEWAKSKLAENGYCCELTGIEFFRRDGQHHRVNPYSPTFDRVNPLKGYTKRNTRIVIYAINVALLDWGQSVFETVSEAYRTKSLCTDQKNLYSPSKSAA